MEILAAIIGGIFAVIAVLLPRWLDARKERRTQQAEQQQNHSHQTSKPVEKSVQPKQPRIVKEWWEDLNDTWKEIFKDVGIDGKSTDSDLEKIVNLDCRRKQLSDLKPLSKLTKLEELNCWDNQISNLGPLTALTKLHRLECGKNKISDLEALTKLTDLQVLYCHENQLRDLEPLSALTNLLELNCNYNKIEDLSPLHALKKLKDLKCNHNLLIKAKIDEFRNAVPNCKVYSAKQDLPVKNLQN
jgi:Leucine-rich repeat (LRR) protein